jgi:hypothetical protein
MEGGIACLSYSIPFFEKIKVFIAAKTIRGDRR